MHKIALVHPYFGKFPTYFELYLETCSFNPTIDFIFFTDCEIPKTYSKNIIFYQYTLDKYNKLASSKLSLPIKLVTPFLLCDMKVSYGVVFEDYLKEYDFWGHADIDLFYGDIRKFINKDILNNYDTIFAKNEYVSGFFALYKNNKNINNLFRKSKDFEMVFTTNKHYSFGECNFKWQQLKSGRKITELDTEIESFTEVVVKETENRNIQSLFKTIAYEAIPNNEQFISWEKGLLKAGDTEIMLFHLVSAKNNKRFIIPDWKGRAEKFFVNQYGFYKEKDFYGIRYFFATLKKRIQFFKKLKFSSLRKKILK